MKTKAEEILLQYWGYDFFRPMQSDIIDSVMAGADTLALLPTGGGKSICFQVPAMMTEGMCIVVSPLIALMTDQVNQLHQRNISAAAITSAMSRREIDILLDNCVLSKIKFLYISPERLNSELFLARVQQMNVSLFAIDEAHCISQWGHDFRPSYSQIVDIFPSLPHVKKIALTATAPKDVQTDILKLLDFKEPVIFQQSFARKNLSYSVFEIENKTAKLFEIFNNVQGSSIVYVRTRKATEAVSRYLVQSGFSADYYHGGLAAISRNKKQNEWINNRTRIMVATNAFGMGIDKADVRTVVHLHIPESLEAYYQEAGRAGRDGRSAYAVLLSNKEDVHELETNAECSHPSLKYIEQIYQALANYYQLAVGSSEWQSFDFDIKNFAYTYNLKPLEVHYAIKMLELMGLLQLNDQPYSSSSLKMLLDNKHLYNFMISNAQYEGVIKALLRLYGGNLFDDFVKISETEMGKMISISKGEVFKNLQALEKQEVIMYDKFKDKPQLTYLMARVGVHELKKYFNPLLPRQKISKSKIDAIVGYQSFDLVCRTRVFQEYFGEQVHFNCGVCDVCLSHKRSESYEEKCLAVMEQIKLELSSDELALEVLKSRLSENNDFLVCDAIKKMLDQNIIVFDDEMGVLHYVIESEND